ncbi:hypothetical protein KUTeg_016655 [Tegillarca granosa]|uniref:Uncharacterized protein n=1 Tax=Tegillarca granosa TaxID=220873 RepID=A0ABQ9ELP6_TEGGR|nr:hypothetical protein KUTeg_016655 [Tegillarca granosa]
MSCHNKPRCVSNLTIADFDDICLIPSYMTYIELGESSLTPNQYVMAVQFYLPGEAGVDLPVNVYSDGQVYRGMFRPRYCPGVSGCRGLIYFVDSPDNHVVTLPTSNVRITFNNTFGKEIWLDYLMLIPASLFSPSDLNLQPVDNSAAFLKNCVGPGFKLLKNCIHAFSCFAVSNFNNGAVACECDIDGSMSFECDRFGGQCQCRDNVIGRQCTDCREGYYGFPNCRPCDCPFGMCQPFTGECICPPRVVGDRCDQCAAETYGYDSLDCNCNSYGSSDLDCDKTTGLCQCLPNVGGRKCDHCLAGYRSFPSCTECDCNESGTNAEICDQDSGICQCKEYVGGRRCDSCQPGYFNIDPMNARGCTPCFCFGATSTCEMSSMYWAEIEDMTGWSITNTVEGAMREAGNVIAVLNILEENKIENPDEAMYWTAPKTYLGDKVSSYGGKLKFMTVAVLPREEDSNVEPLELQRPDVIIAGPNGTITYMFEDVPAQVSNNEVLMTEKYFMHSSDGSKVTRDQFMMILADINGLMIRANFYTNTKEVRLQNVKLDVASRDGLGDQAITVEQCLCPPGYNGTSCENKSSFIIAEYNQNTDHITVQPWIIIQFKVEMKKSCSRGYYRSRSFPYLGVCSPCNCNGHTDKCDPETGKWTIYTVNRKSRELRNAEEILLVIIVNNVYLINTGCILINVILQLKTLGTSTSMNPIMPEIKHDLFEREHSARSAPTKRRRLQLTSAAWQKFSGLTQISSLRTVFMSVHKTTIQGS